MPHLIVEYSENLAEGFKQSKILEKAHSALMASGVFNPGDLKSRSIMLSDYLVGEEPAKEKGFVHAVIYLLEGRTVEQKSALTNAVMKVLEESFSGQSVQLSVDIRDMLRETYRKS